MANFNQLTLIGRPTRDPEIRSYNENGDRFAKFGFCVNDKYGDRETTTFLDCVVFGGLVKIVEQYVRKGEPVFLQGRLKMDRWDDAGTMRTKHEMIVDIVRLLGSSKPSSSRPSTGQHAERETGYRETHFTGTEETPF